MVRIAFDLHMAFAAYLVGDKRHSTWGCQDLRVGLHCFLHGALSSNLPVRGL